MRYRDVVRRSLIPATSRRGLRSPLQRSSHQPIASPMSLGGGEKELFHVVAELQPANLVKLDSAKASA